MHPWKISPVTTPLPCVLTTSTSSQFKLAQNTTYRVADKNTNVFIYFCNNTIIQKFFYFDKNEHKTERKKKDKYDKCFNINWYTKSDKVADKNTNVSIYFCNNSVYTAPQ